MLRYERNPFNFTFSVVEIFQMRNGRSNFHQIVSEAGSNSDNPSMENRCRILKRKKVILIIDQFHLRGIPLAGSTLKSLSMIADY